MKPVLIAALSARALAQSARRAGYAPLVVDAFGDEDTLAAAAQHEKIPSPVHHGFERLRLLQALNRLASTSPVEPFGLVLGSGFEGNPTLMAELGRKHRLLGCRPDAVRRVKEPDTFFPELDRLGVPHPEIAMTAPCEPRLWLKKLIGAHGGTHIATSASRGFAKADVYSRRFSSTATFHRRYYYQRRVSGQPISLLGVADGGAFHPVAFSRQWTNPVRRGPFRYGGAVGPIRLSTQTANAMLRAAQSTSECFGLLGLVSFDFIAGEDGPSLLEVNPRPGATMDVFDDGNGGLFAAHIAACLNSERESANPSPPTPSFPQRREPTTHLGARDDLDSGDASQVDARPGGADSVQALALRLQKRVLGSRLRGNDEEFGAMGANIGSEVRASAYLYADRGPLKFPQLDWPDWAADRPHPRTHVARGQPIATASASGDTPEEAEALCRKRLGLLEDMIYDRALKTGARP